MTSPVKVAPGQPVVGPPGEVQTLVLGLGDLHIRRIVRERVE